METERSAAILAFAAVLRGGRQLRAGPCYDPAMPILDVTLLTGRTHEKKVALVKELTDATVRALDVPPESVRVLLREIEPSHFAVAGELKGPPPK
jgi:4-oxalocrotonate tautomerase